MKDDQPPPPHQVPECPQLPECLSHIDMVHPLNDLNVFSGAHIYTTMPAV